MKKPAILGALLALLLIVTGCSAGKVNKVCELTEADIKSRLKAPATSQFPDCADRGVEEVEPDIFMVDSYYDAQNGFGAMIRGEYLCQVSFEGNKEEVICTTF